MMDHDKYTRAYFLPPEESTSWVHKDHLDQAPVWCSVDLRDGNQALSAPMTLEQKLRFFQLLVKMGFTQIEAGFPAASKTEYRFIRTLIERDLIPENVTIQVLTQAREPIIRKTFEAIEGAKNAIVHIYNPTSRVQRTQVFGMSREEVLGMAVDGARLLKTLAEEMGNHFRFEYSPESFTATESEYALEVCNAVLDVWQPAADRKAVINLPATVELSMPHVYAQQIEYMHKHLHYREGVELSLHPHNDRGCAVAAAELGLLAGADRVEGTLFGNGERSGNVDIVTLAMNLYAHGVDPKLDLADMSYICREYEACTSRMVEDRRPYSGSLVYAAFSGSHQDAIAKSIKYNQEHSVQKWNVPYLPIDPADIGRSTEEEVIRINSQSGKGGVGFILEQDYGLRLPAKMREAVSFAAKEISDLRHSELAPEEVFSLFKSRFENITAPYDIRDVRFTQHNGIIAEVTALRDGQSVVITANGNGRLNAVSNAIKKCYPVEYDLVTYEEHALEMSSSSRAIAYVGIRSRKTGALYWGAGVDVDIIHASVGALLTAVNNMANAS